MFSAVIFLNFHILLLFLYYGESNANIILYLVLEKQLETQLLTKRRLLVRASQELLLILLPTPHQNKLEPMRKMEA